MKREVIMGIDPGFGITGFSILQKEGTSASLLDFGYLKLPTNKHLSDRVGIFFSVFDKKIKQFNVSTIALETPFLGKNAQTFLKLGYLRGILYLLASTYKLTIHEFSPREVKAAITGYGGASKDQVATMVMRLFPKIVTTGSIEKNDVTDSVAVSIAGLLNAHQLKKRKN